MNKKVAKLAQAHDTQTTDFDWAGIEGEFNHQHIIAKGIAGLLFRTSEKDGFLGNPEINGAAYSIESALKEMNILFQSVLKSYLDATACGRLK